MSASIAPTEPPRPAGTPADASSSAPAPAGSAPGPTPAETDATRVQLERVFSPEIAAMLVTAAFGVAAVATGEPDIWQATDEEIEPLAPAVGRQLSRIPIIRAIGPDNAEAGIVVLGLGVMVTRRLNAHARKRQGEAAARRAELERGSETADRAPTDLATERARRTPAPARSAAVGEDGTASAHFGMRV